MIISSLRYEVDLIEIIVPTPAPSTKQKNRYIESGIVLPKSKDMNGLIVKADGKDVAMLVGTGVFLCIRIAVCFLRPHFGAGSGIIFADVIMGHEWL